MPEDNDATDDKDAKAPLGHRAAATLFICAAIGGLCAAVADVVQKDDASAVSKITSVAARNLDLLVKPLWVLLGRVTLAMLLCFVFQPRGRRAAFGIGAGVIATIMTVTPYQQPLTGLPITENEDGAWRAPGRGLQVAALGGAQVLTVAKSAYKTYRFTVTNRATRTVRAAVAVFDRRSGQEYRQTQDIGIGAAATFPFALSGLRQGEAIYYTVSVDGAAAVRDEIAIDAAPRRDIAVTLTDAMIGVPKTRGSILQRLQKRLDTGTRF
jgi:hypothetical protein